MLAENTVLQGRYRIIRLINQGNMGAVYLAEDTRLGNEIALKETFSAGGDAELREQFHREARLLSKLRHSSLPRVIDHFNDGSGQFLVMDYIVGEDLQESLRSNGGPFPVDRVLGWADQLLEVLAYLHEHEDPVIHRDIKPANIKLTPQGKVILLDFGLAKGSTASMQMSFRAMTMAYAPIEQVTCQGTDARSDLYALAVTLYHLLTGALPPIALQRSQAVWQGQPDPLIPADHLNPQVPAAISQALTQAMSLQANDRPASADVMHRMLRGAAGNEQPTVIAPVAPEITTTIPIASEARKENGPSTIIRPSSLVYDFDVVTVNAKGEITNRRKGQARYDVEDLNGVALEMVEIPGDTFTMGSPDTEADRHANEGPPHQVTVSPFYMGKYVVTQAQWRAGASLPNVKIDLNPAPSRFKGDDLPVEQVSWEDAMEFCERLSRVTGKRYRLPSEAEWEYACRAGTTTPFAFGETITPELVNYDGNYPYANAPKGEYRKKTTPVGSLGVANGFGLYDMHGNVWEWCMDWYSENYYSQSPSADPTGPSTGSDRVGRGGSWRSYARNVRSAFRDGFAPSNRIFDLGFRVLRTYP